MYVCPICHARTDDRRAHLDWHAARSTAAVRRRRIVLDPIPAGQTVTVTVTWATAMPDDAYTVSVACDAPLLGAMDLTVTDLTDTGCTVHLTPAYDLDDAVLDLTAHIPVEETPDGH